MVDLEATNCLVSRLHLILLLSTLAKQSSMQQKQQTYKPRSPTSGLDWIADLIAYQRKY